MLFHSVYSRNKRPVHNIDFLHDPALLLFPYDLRDWLNEIAHTFRDAVGCRSDS